MGGFICIEANGQPHCFRHTVKKVVLLLPPKGCHFTGLNRTPMGCNHLAPMGVHELLKGVILGCIEVPLRVLYLDVLQYCQKVLSQTK